MRRYVPWLLTLGFLVITLAGSWQFMESVQREVGDELFKPCSLPYEPRATLVERIRASWEPGDRLRSALLLAGLGLGALLGLLPLLSARLAPVAFDAREVPRRGGG